MTIFNGSLLKNPMNWFIIWTMVLLLVFAGHFVLQHFQNSGSSGANAPGVVS